MVQNQRNHTSHDSRRSTALPSCLNAAMNALEKDAKARGDIRRRGKALPFATRVKIVLAVFLGPYTYRKIATTHHCSIGTVSRLKQCTLRVFTTTAPSPSPLSRRRSRSSRQTIHTLLPRLRECLTSKKRGPPRGHGAKLSMARHGDFVKRLVAERPDIYIDEIQCELQRTFFSQDSRIGYSTVARFLRNVLNLHRKRKSGHPLPSQHALDRSLPYRRSFVSTHFGRSANMDAVGTAHEVVDQRQWRLRSRLDPRCYFFCDETGINRKSANRAYARVPRGMPCPHGQSDVYSKGPNHSVLIATSRDRQIMASDILVKVGKGTCRNDFARFVRRRVGPAMLERATAMALPPHCPLFLVLDNASIHKGDVVHRALSEGTCGRGRLLFLPPYASTMNPVELVNARLKSMLRRNFHDWAMLGQSQHLSLRTFIEELMLTMGHDSAHALYAHCGWRQ